MTDHDHEISDDDSTYVEVRSLLPSAVAADERLALAEAFDLDLPTLFEVLGSRVRMELTLQTLDLFVMLLQAQNDAATTAVDDGDAQRRVRALTVIFSRISMAVRHALVEGAAEAPALLRIDPVDFYAAEHDLVVVDRSEHTIH